MPGILAGVYKIQWKTGKVILKKCIETIQLSNFIRHQSNLLIFKIRWEVNLLADLEH